MSALLFELNIIENKKKVSYPEDENHSLHKVDWNEKEQGHDESAEWHYVTNESDSTKNAANNAKIVGFVHKGADVATEAK